MMIRLPSRRRPFGMMLLFSLGLSLSSRPLESAQHGASDQTTAFVNVSVVTMKDERFLLDQTVLVRHGVIARIGAFKDVRVPPGTRVIDGRGKFLAPGLADMHTHVDSPEEFPLFLANGVTTTLNMGGASRDYVGRLRAEVRSGRVLGPDPLIALMVDGPGDRGGSAVVPDSVEEARRVIQQAKADRYDYIKVYSRLTPEMFAAIMDEARRIGIPVVGHVVRSVGLKKSIESGQTMIAHAEEYLTVFNDDPPDSASIPELVKLSLARHVYVTANLIGIDRIAEQWGKGDTIVEGYLAKPEAQHLRPALQAKWRKKGYTRLKGSYDAEAKFCTDLVLALHKAQVPILVGTDTPDIPGVTPGYSVHDEIELLSRIGFGNYGALSAATRIPGEFVEATHKGPKRFGIVAPGYRADVLLLNSNPLKDLTVLRHPQGVMVRGIWLSGEQLTRQLH